MLLASSSFTLSNNKGNFTDLLSPRDVPKTAILKKAPNSLFIMKITAILLCLSIWPIYAITPYQAHYAIYWYGIKAGSSKHYVNKLSTERYQVIVETSPDLPFIPYQFYDKSEFLYRNNTVQPLYHEFDHQEKTKNFHGKMTFSQKNQSITHFCNNKKTTYDTLNVDIYDKISHGFQLKADLATGKKSLTYVVAKPRGLNEYAFKITGYETLKTSIGILKAIRIEHQSPDSSRRTILWLAPELNYLLLKIYRLRHDKLVGKALIKKFKQH